MLSLNEIINGVIDLAENHRELNKEAYQAIRSQFSNEAFINECCTLRLVLPRCSGNSEAVVQAAKTLNCPIIVPYALQVGVLLERGAKDVMDLITAKRVERHSLKSIVVDAAAALSTDQMKFLHTLIDINKDGWLVLIG